MKELTPLQILSAYLPYQLKGEFRGDRNYKLKTIQILDRGDIKNLYYNIIPFWKHPQKRTEGNGNIVMPLLHPLSKITQEIEHNGYTFRPVDLMLEYSDVEQVIYPELAFESTEKIYFEDFYKNHYSKLLEWHFDVFGLIEQGKALPK